MSFAGSGRTRGRSSGFGKEPRKLFAKSDSKPDASDADGSAAEPLLAGIGSELAADGAPVGSGCRVHGPVESPRSNSLEQHMSPRSASEWLLDGATSAHAAVKFTRRTGTSLPGALVVDLNDGVDAIDLGLGSSVDARAAAAMAAKKGLEEALLALSQAISHTQASMASMSGALAGSSLAHLSNSCPEQMDGLRPMEPIPSFGSLGSSDDSRRLASDSGPEVEGRPMQAGTPPEDAGIHFGSEQQVNAETLPETWPGSLEIRWKMGGDPGESMMVQRMSSRRALTGSHAWMSRHLAGGDDETRVEHSSEPWFVIHPSSYRRAVYDPVCVALLLFDCATVPFMVAWDIPPAGGLYYMAWVRSVFWTLDMGVSSITAFSSGGEFIFDLSAIMWNYFRTWFFLDLITVTCDWASLFLTCSQGWNTLQFAGIGQLLNLVDMVRMWKLHRILSDFIDETLSDMPDTAQLPVRIGKMISAMLAYAHVICCIWFFVGRAAPTDTGMRWLDEIEQKGIAYQYITSFHWAMTQITLGPFDVPSGTVIERVYSIVVLVMGLLFGSALVSTLSATMLEVHMDDHESHLRMQQMRRYLRENSFDRILVSQVEKQLKDRLATKPKLTEDEVTGLALLSSSLRSKLRLNLCIPYLRCHSLFHMWIDVDTLFVERFCTKCIEFAHLRNEDDLFASGKGADFAYFFIAGDMKYTQEPESSPLTTVSVRIVPKGSWIAEAALWSHWVHVGTCQATHFSEVAEVRVSMIMELMQRTTTIIQLTGDYCRNFHRRLQQARPPASSWPDDLQVPATDWSDMVLSMEMDSQIIIGLRSIREATLTRSWMKWATGLQNLTDEVKHGKSIVMLDGNGEMQRVVSVVVLKVYNDARQILAQIGKYESGTMVPLCQLPGMKQERGELAVDTLKRVLPAKLACIADHVEVRKAERETQVTESKEYGVRTKYLRHVVFLQLESGSGLEDTKLPDVVSWDGTPVRPEAGRSGGPTAKSTLQGNAARTSRPEAGGSIKPALKSSLLRASEEALFRNSICQRSVYRMSSDRQKGSFALYAWFTEQEFERLKGAPGEAALAAWCASLGAYLKEAGVDEFE